MATIKQLGIDWGESLFHAYGGLSGAGVSSPLGRWQDDLARHHQARRPLAADVTDPERACRLAQRPVKDLQTHS